MVMKMPSWVSPMISVERALAGLEVDVGHPDDRRFCQPSARMAPVDRPADDGAVSRLEMKFWKMPSSMSSVRWAGTPSSS